MNDDTPAEASMREAEGAAIRISSNLPDLVNHYITIREQRIQADKDAKTLKDHEEELKKTIIEKFKGGDMTAFGASKGIVKMTQGSEPVCNDWPALYEHIKETGHFEYLHKRVTVTAIKEHYDVGETVPGISFVDTFKLTVSAPPK